MLEDAALEQDDLPPPVPKAPKEDELEVVELEQLPGLVKPPTRTPILLQYNTQLPRINAQIVPAYSVATTCTSYKAQKLAF